MRWRSTASSVWAMRRLSLERSSARFARALIRVSLQCRAECRSKCWESLRPGSACSRGVAVGQCCRLLWHVRHTHAHSVGRVCGPEAPVTAPCWCFTDWLVPAQDKPWRRHTPSSVQARARNHKTPLLSPISGMRVNAAAPAGPVQRCGAESGTEPERVGGVFIEEGKRAAPNA